MILKGYVMQKNQLPRQKGGTNNTTMEQVACKVKIFVWVAFFIMIILLSTKGYDPDHKVMFILMPIAFSIPAAWRVQILTNKLRDLKESEKFYVTREVQYSKKKNKKNK